MRCQGRPIQRLLICTVVAALTPSATAKDMKWQTNPPAALQQAAATGRPLLIKFTADWCGYCKKMERTTFSDSVTVETVHRGFVPLLVDADRHADLTRELQIKGLPAILIVNADMTVLERITGYQTTKKLLPKLQAVLAAYRRTDRVMAVSAAQQRNQPIPPHRTADDDQSFDRQTPAKTRLSVGSNFSLGLGSSTDQNTPTAEINPSFDGICLTSVVDERNPVAGTPEFAAEYRGQILHFRNADQRNQFFLKPEKYWPVLDGHCSMTLLESGRLVPGHLKHAAVYRNRIWTFQTRTLMTKFIASPAEHVANIEELQKQSKTSDRSF
ncbi:MAG: thioredoxin family protein [Fuerstiella sp.]|nr:thioredoxin family protein [Fuerstiella sp.]